MARYYYLGPWVSDTIDGEACFRAPDHTVGSVDLRPLSPVSTYGFFATDTPITDSSYEPFGDGAGNRIEDVHLTAAQRNRWQSMLGLAALSGVTLLDALWETLTVQADPDGNTHALPLMPTHSGQLELHLGGHSLVRSERFSLDHPSFSQVQKVLQNSFRAIEAQDKKGSGKGKSVDAETRLKWLGGQQEKYGLTDDQVTALLIPSDMAAERPMKPSTVLSSSWPGYGPLNTTEPGIWSLLSGEWPASDDGLLWSGNVGCRMVNKSPLSKPDHYTSLTTMDDCYMYPMARCQSGTADSDHYRARFVRDETTNANRIQVVCQSAGGSVLGVDTQQIWTETIGGRYQGRLLCTGSTITAILLSWAGVPLKTISWTNTAVPAGLYAGLEVPVNQWLRGFEASDELGGPAGVPYPWYHPFILWSE